MKPMICTNMRLTTYPISTLTILPPSPLPHTPPLSPCGYTGGPVPARHACSRMLFLKRLTLPRSPLTLKTKSYCSTSGYCFSGRSAFKEECRKCLLAFSYSRTLFISLDSLLFVLNLLTFDPECESAGPSDFGGRLFFRKCIHMGLVLLACMCAV